MFGKTTTSSSGTSNIVLTDNTLLLGQASCPVVTAKRDTDTGTAARANEAETLG